MSKLASIRVHSCPLCPRQPKHLVAARVQKLLDKGHKITWDRLRFQLLQLVIDFIEAGYYFGNFQRVAIGHGLPAWP